jgi:hypothetical protein
MDVKDTGYECVVGFNLLNVLPICPDLAALFLNSISAVSI